MDVLLSTDAPDRSLLRFDPTLERAIDLALGSGFLRQTPTPPLALTPSGRAVVEQIQADDTVLAGEKQALRHLPRRFTQRDAARLLRIGNVT